MKKTVFILFILLTSFLKAQETLPITLEKVLELGGANNLTIKEYQERQNLANANLEKAKEWWVPEIYGGGQIHQLWGAVMNGNGRFFLDANRNNLWLGIGINASFDFAEGIYGTKAIKRQTEASKYFIQAERNKELLNGINAYYKLLTAQMNYAAYKNLVEQSETIAQQIQIQVDAGLRYQSEILMAQSNKNHLKIEMLNAENEFNMASAELLELLNIDQNVKLVSVDSTLVPLDYSEELFAVSDSLFLNRPEIKANEIEIEVLEMKKRTFTKGLLLPELNIGLSTSYFGRLNRKVVPMDPIAFPSTNQLYGTNAINASLLWKIPLGTLIYKGDENQYKSLIRLKEIETEQYKTQISAEIASAKIQLQTRREQIEIAKEALELTTEALNQSIERQKLGTAKPFEVFQAQQFFLQSQIDYLNAVGDYNKAQFAIKVAKGEDL